MPGIRVIPCVVHIEERTARCVRHEGSPSPGRSQPPRSRRWRPSWRSRGAAAAVTTAAPDNTTEPRISGSAVVGSELTASQGSWTGSPTSFAYQWVRCPRGGGLPTGADCATIGGATTTKYVVATADVDRRLRVRVTASNSDGSKTVASNATALVRAADAGRPANVQAPTLSGAAAQGQTLHVTPGTWNGQQPITFTFNWLRCDTGGEQLRPAVRIPR